MTLPIPELVTLTLALLMAFAAAPSKVISLDTHRRRRRAAAPRPSPVPATGDRGIKLPTRRLTGADQWQRLAVVVTEGRERALSARASHEAARIELGAIELGLIRLEEELAAIVPALRPQPAANRQPLRHVARTAARAA